MILTVTMNPCIDRYVETDSLTVGGTNRIDLGNDVAGGKGINVARVLKSMGKEPLCTGLSFTDGSEVLTEALYNAGIAEDMVTVKGKLRVNLKIRDKNGVTTEINQTGECPDGKAVYAVIDKIIKYAPMAEAVVLSGSLPKGVAPCFYGDIIRELNEHGVITVLDTGGQALKDGIPASPRLLKPNYDEITAMAGVTSATAEELARIAAGLCREHGVGMVSVSLGGEGAVITDGNTAFLAKNAEVDVVCTTGAGDAMVAAQTFALCRGFDMDQVLRLGMAAGNAWVAKPAGDELDYRLMRSLMGKINIERINL